MLIKCPECENQISDKAISCPKCGYPMSMRASAPVYKPKKKFMRLPNGYGTIRHLKGNRRNPYAVYPPVIDYHDNGSPVQRKALGYYATYNEAYECLAMYHQTTNISRNTFKSVYEKFVNSPLCKSKSNSTIQMYKFGFNHLKEIWNEDISALRTDDIQRLIDNARTHSIASATSRTLKRVCQYALQQDLITKDYAQFCVVTKERHVETGVPFFEDELKILWDNRDKEFVKQIWVLILTGVRISEYVSMDYDPENQCLVGGVKTKAGKRRIIPIHKEIQMYIPDRVLSVEIQTIRRYFENALSELGILNSVKGTKHTPHDCRHTFNWLCDKFELSNTARHKIMGHASGDMEIDVYGHKTLEELRTEIDKIDILSIVDNK